MEDDDVGRNTFRRWHSRLAAPSARLKHAAIREQSTVLSWLLLFMLVWLSGMALLLRFILTPGMGWRNPELLIVVAALLLLFLALWLNRRGHYLPAASLTVVTLLVGVFVGTHITLLGMLEPYYSHDSVHILSYLLLPMILGAILLPMRLLVAILLLTAAGVAAVPVVHPHVDWTGLLQGPLSYVIAVGALMLFLSYVVNMTRRGRYQMIELREQRYHSLFEQSPDAMFLVSTDGRIEAVNSAGLSLFGYERDELGGGFVRQLYAVPEERAALIAKAERQGILVDEPLRMRRKDGSVLDCLVSIRLRTDPEGRVAGYQTVVRDVTSRMQTEEDLWLKGQLLDLAHDTVLLVDPGGEIAYANSAAAALTGYSAEELVGMNIRQLNTREGAEQVPDRISRLIRQKELDFETRWVRKDGSVIDVEARTRTIESRGRTLFLSVVRDVTQRKADQADLRLRGELLDLASDAVLLHDLKGKLLYANEAAAHQTGYSRSELIGMSLRELDDAATSARMNQRMGELMNRRAIAFEGVHRRKDGTVVPVDVRARIVDWEERGIVLSVARDISERKKADEALRESEERFRSLFEQSIDAIFGNAPDGSRMEANSAWMAMFGYSPDDLATMNAADLYVNPEDRDGFLCAMTEAGFVRDEVQLKRKDGTAILCQRVAFARKDSVGRVVAYQGIVRDITAEKRTERELRESEERYRTLFEQSLVAIWTLRADGTGHVVNQAWLDMFGYTKEDLASLNAVDLYVDPADRDDFLRHILRSGFVRDKVWFKKKDGTHRLCDRAVVARRDETGRVVAFQGVIRDITEEEQRKAALAEEVARRRLLVEQSRDGIVVLDEQGGVVETNLTFARMLGYSMEEVHRLHVWDWEAATPRDVVVEMIRTVDETGDHFETRHRRKDGTVYDVEISTNGAVFGGRKLIFCVCRDISARKDAERELRKSEEKYRALFEQSMDAIYINTPDGTTIEANQAWLDLFGYTRQELRQVSAIDLYAEPADRTAFVEQMAEHGAVSDEIRYKRKDGTILDIQRAVVARRDSSGRVVAFQGVMRDITEQKRAERELRESEARYKALVEHPGVAMTVTTPEDGLLLDFNDAFAERVGYSRDELLGTSVGQLYARPEERADLIAELRSAGYVRAAEVELRRRDGSSVFVSLTMITVRQQGRDVIVAHGLDITERRRVEAALQQSEDKYRALFEQSMDAVAVYGLDGTLLDANPAHLALFGLSPADVGGRSVLSLYVNPADRDEFLRLLERDGVVVDQEVRLRKMDGTEMDCVRTAVARRDAGGRLVAAQTVTRDITEKKRAESALRESEQRYRMIADDTIDVIWRMDLDMRFTYVNPAIERMFGFTPEQWMGTSVGDHCSPEEFSRIRTLASDRIQHYLATGEHGRGILFEATMFDSRGAEVPVEVRAKLVLSADGRPVALHGITRDITERKRAEQELRDSETRFRALVEHTGLGTAITRPDGTIIDCNDVLPAMLGFSREEFLALRVPDVYASREEREAVLAQALRDGYVRDVEVTFRRKDGASVYVRMTSALVPMRGSTVIVSQFLDITGRKAAELEILQSREELKRSAEQLQELTTYLEEAREKERTGIARELHDQLGQALTALRMDLDGVRRTAIAGEPAPADRLDRMAALLDDTVNDVRRISSELRPGILDDAGLVPAVEWQLERFRERTGIDCRLEARDDGADLNRAQSTALFRVFQELLTNVARHAGATRVRVVFERVGGEYVLSVSDDGRGITEDQVKDASSLGLIGIRERLRPLGGGIEFLRRRPRGTTVRVALPASHGAQDHA